MHGGASETQDLKGYIHMNLATKLRSIAERIEQLGDTVGTEEATKHAFVLPFLAALGHDVFDPTQVVPEYVADIGTKRGEKIDYMVMIEGRPTIMIECKPLGAINGSRKYLGILDANKKETRFEVEDVDDIFRYAEELRERVRFLDGGRSDEDGGRQADE